MSLNKFLSLDSNILLKFIDNFDISNTQLPKISKSKLLKIRKDLYHIIKNLDNIQFILKSYNDINSVLKILRYSNFSSFNSYDIKKLEKYIFTYGSNKVNFIVDNSISTINIVYLAKITFIFLGFFNITNHEQNIFIVLSNKNKQISNGILGSKNVNSGFTIINSGDIYLYRKEEIVKVLIHELIHATKNDLSDNISLKYSEKVKKIFGLDNILVNESFTEFRATIMNLLFNIAYIDYYNNTDYIFKLNFYLFNEIKHSIIQTLKIMDHNRINNLLSIKNYREKSNIFAYYVLKSILLYNINIYLDNIIIRNNSNDLFFINKVFSKFYLNNFTSELDEIQKKLLDIKPENFVRNNLRMTLYEFNLNAFKR